MFSTDPLATQMLPDPPVAMFSATGHQDTVWSDVKGSVAHSKMIKWTGGIAATHAITKVSGSAEVRTRSLELHSGVAEAEAESGKQVWAYKNRPRYGIILSPGTNVEFRIREKSNYRFLAMEFEPVYLLRAAELQHLGSVEFFESWEHDDPLTWHLAEAIFGECESGARQGLLYSETAATLLALQVIQNLSNRTGPTKFLNRGGLAPAVLRRACDYMVHRLGDDISLSELANASGLSAGHFALAFKQSTGISPHSWLRRQRIDAAKVLLRSPDVNLSSIAASVGFTSQSAFGAAFRRETGMTPTDWRRLHWL